jgi:hypothetical protein
MVSQFEKNGHAPRNGYNSSKYTRHHPSPNGKPGGASSQASSASMGTLQAPQSLSWTPHSRGGNPRQVDSICCDRMALLIDGSNLFYAAAYLNIGLTH